MRIKLQMKKGVLLKFSRMPNIRFAEKRFNESCIDYSYITYTIRKTLRIKAAPIKESQQWIKRTNLIINNCGSNY